MIEPTGCNGGWSHTLSILTAIFLPWRAVRKAEVAATMARKSAGELTKVLSELNDFEKIVGNKK